MPRPRVFGIASLLLVLAVCFAPLARMQCGTWLGVAFLLPVALTIVRSLWYGSLAVAGECRARRRCFDPRFQPPVSVVITARNRENAIACAVEDVLRNGYPEVEIVVVDDGSTDQTLEVLRAGYGSDPHVRIVSQPREGKAPALERGVARASHEIVIALAADAVLRRGAIAQLVRHFADPGVRGVSGSVRVGGRGWMAAFQSIQYRYGFSLDRRALEMLGVTGSVPGAAVAWRKRLPAQPLRYEENAVAYIPAAERVGDLARGDPGGAFRAGGEGFVAVLALLVCNVLLPALAPFTEPAMLAAWLMGDRPVVLTWYAAFLAVEWLTGALVYRLEGGRAWELALLVPQRIFHRQLTGYLLARRVAQSLGGRVSRDGAAERRAAAL